MVKTCGKALLGLCAAAAVLALLIHWITPATILHYREDLLFYLHATPTRACAMFRRR